jgi:hypothetical protein
LIQGSNDVRGDGMPSLAFLFEADVLQRQVVAKSFQQPLAHRFHCSSPEVKGKFFLKSSKTPYFHGCNWVISPLERCFHSGLRNLPWLHAEIGSIHLQVHRLGVGRASFPEEARDC